MLVRFRVVNHRSFREEQELSFATGLSHRRGLEMPQVGVPVLPAMAIHGANASGKSNVLDALQFFAQAVRRSYRSWNPDGGVPRSPFAFCAEPAVEPSTFEVDFVAEGARWVYGADLDSQRVTHEWLYQYGESRRRRTLFERNAKEFSFGATFSGPNQTIAKLTRGNSLFLSTAAQNGHEGVMPVWRWFRKIRFADPGDLTARQSFTTGLLDKPELRAVVMQAMKAADFGLVDLKVVETEIPEAARRFVELIARESSPPTEVPSNLTRSEVQFKHAAGTHSAFLDWEDESHGTRAWFGLLGPMLLVLREGSLLCFDELDHHLHPLLVEQIVTAFQDPRVNRHGAQLLFTTQRTFDLRPSPSSDSGEPVLDRDQIWLTEKEPSGESRLYPLSNYRPRRRQNLERAYLQGRFGGVPYADVRDALVSALDAYDAEQVREE